MIISMAPAAAQNNTTSGPNGCPEVPVGPIFLPRQKQRKQSNGTKAEHGCPMGFVRPDGASRCAWLQTGPRTPVDMSAMTQVGKTEMLTFFCLFSPHKLPYQRQANEKVECNKRGFI